MGTIKVYDSVFGRNLLEVASMAGTTKAEVLGCLVTIWQWAMDKADENGIVYHCDKKDVINCLSVVSDDLYTEISEALFSAGYVREENGSLIFRDWWRQQSWHHIEESARKKDSERKRKKRMASPESPKLPVTEPVASKEPEQQVTKEPQEKKPEEKKKPAKKHYAEFVLLTKEEYEKLCEKYGEPIVTKAIDILNQYIGSTGKKYKSHYMTIIGWPVKEACKQNPSLFRQHTESTSSDNNENPYQEYLG